MVTISGAIKLLELLAEHGAHGRQLLEKYGKDMAQAIEKLGDADDVVRLLDGYPDNGADLLKAITRYGDDAVELIGKYGDDAIGQFKAGKSTDEVRMVFEGGSLSDDRVTYYLSKSLNNANSNTAILGSTGSYDVIGEAKGYTYFKMKDEIWAQLETETMQNYDEIWKVNKLFIDDQVNAGKRILLSNDPYAGYYFNDGSKRFYQREIDYLKELGYTFNSIGDLWEVVK